eukprot:9134241-Alexandrium_andersonii.AAC.1
MLHFTHGGTLNSNGTLSSQAQPLGHRASRGSPQGWVLLGVSSLWRIPGPAVDRSALQRGSDRSLIQLGVGARP